MKKLCFFLAVLLCSCHQRQSANKGQQASGSNSSNCIKLDDDAICIPLNWKLVPQSKFLLFTDIGKKDSNAYFVIIKHNELTSSLSATSYLKTIYNALSSDSQSEKAIGYTTKKLYFENDSCYYSEFHTKIKDDDCITFSIVFERNEDLYEVALKTEKLNSTQFKSAFNSAFFSFKHNEIPFFSQKDVIKRTELIDLSKL